MSLDDPSQLLRTLAAEVWRRVEEWHEHPDWRDDQTNRYRYDITARTIAALDAFPDPHDSSSTTAFVDAIRPITDTWRPNRTGPEQAIYAAVDRLRDATRRLTHPEPGDA